MIMHGDQAVYQTVTLTFISTVFANCHKQYRLVITNCSFFVRLPVLLDRLVQVFNKLLPAGEQSLIGPV